MSEKIVTFSDIKLSLLNDQISDEKEFVNYEDVWSVLSHLNQVPHYDECYNSFSTSCIYCIQCQARSFHRKNIELMFLFLDNKFETLIPNLRVSANTLMLLKSRVYRLVSLFGYKYKSFF